MRLAIVAVKNQRHFPCNFAYISVKQNFKSNQVAGLILLMGLNLIGLYSSSSTPSSLLCDPIWEIKTHFPIYYFQLEN